MRFAKKSTGPRQPRPQSTLNQRAPTFSYRANRLPENDRTSPKRGAALTRKDPRQFLTWQKLPALGMTLVIVICGVYLSTLSTNPKIVDQNGPGQASVLLRDQSVYKTKAEQILKRSISNRSKITFDSTDIDKQMRQAFPEITATAVTLPLMGRRPIVELVVAQPQLILTNSSGSYVLDANGRAVAERSEVQAPEKLQVPVVGDQTNSKIELGKGALSSQSVTFITAFVRTLAERQITVNSVTLPAAASEVQLKIDGQNYYIKASLLSDPRQAAGAYLAITKKLSSEGATPSEYIDLRVEEKVFVK